MEEIDVPRELAGGRAPPVLEVLLVWAAVLLAVELRLHKGAPRRVVHRQRAVVHPAALEQVARRHSGAGDGATSSSVPVRFVLPPGLVPEAQRARARRGAARARQRTSSEKEEEELLPTPKPRLGRRHCSARCGVWGEEE
jgi:hypothetical protein